MNAQFFAMLDENVLRLRVGYATARRVVLRRNGAQRPLTSRMRCRRQTGATIKNSSFPGWTACSTAGSSPGWCKTSNTLFTAAKPCSLS